MAEFVTIRGMTQTVRALRALPAELASKGGGPIRSALHYAASIVRQAAQDKAPTGFGTPNPGNLKANVFIYRDRDPRRSGATERYIIDVRSKRKSRAVKKAYQSGMLSKALRSFVGGDAWYWHFVEHGTKTQRAQKFMTKAFEENKGKVVPAFQLKLAQGVRQAVQRARQKGGA